MGFIYSNPNPVANLVGDCVIRGITILEDSRWEDIYMRLALEGFKMHDMPSSNAVWGNYLRGLGYRRYSIPNTCPECYTIREFCIDHPSGRFLLATGSHVVAVINGDYFDIWDSGTEIPIFYWTKEEINGL